MYVNGPRITDNDWSEAGWAKAATLRYNTHASGLYLVSFGQNFTPTDYGYGVIAPSGLHLEPHGAHQAIRIDGTGNAGENMRIDVMAGATGLSVYGSETEALSCEELGFACEETRLAIFRGGIFRLEDATVERSAVDARDAGVVTVADSSLGIEHFYSWHDDAETGLPAHSLRRRHHRRGRLQRGHPRSRQHAAVPGRLRRDPASGLPLRGHRAPVVSAPEAGRA